MNRRYSLCSIVVLSLLGWVALAAPALAGVPAPGSLDTTFDGDGFAVSDLHTPGGSDEGNAAAVQENGRVLVAGHAGEKLALVRYRKNGALDTSFSGDGLAKASAGTSQSWAAVEALANGKIVVAGSAHQLNPPEAGTDVVVGRYLATGKPDTAFSGDGIKVFGHGSGLDRSFDLVPMGGKLLIVGDTNSEATGFDVALARLTKQGKLDPSFGEGGKVVTPVTAASDQGIAAVATGGGSFVVAGGSEQAGTGQDFTLVGYDSSGELDPEFDGDSGVGNGIVSTPVAAGSNFDKIQDAAAGADGRIVVAGRVDAPGAGHNFGVARYLADGTLDDGFAGDGTVTTAAAPSSGDDEAFAVAVAGDGSVLAGGEADVDATAATNKNAAVLRYTEAGVLDPSFDGDSGSANGIVLTPFGPPSFIDRILGLAISGDKLVAGGAVDPVGDQSERNFLAARYLLTGP